MKQITVPTELTSPILEWISQEDNREGLHVPPAHKGTVVGARHLQDESSALYEEVMAIDRYVLEAYGLSLDTPFDPKDGVFLSYSIEGHKVHVHKDNNPDDNTLHIRFNVMISKPTKGGDPILYDSNDENPQAIQVAENQTWVCEAGNYAHSIETVEGDKPRVMLSLGHYVDKEVWNNLQ